MPVCSHSHAYVRKNPGIYPRIIGKGLKGKKSSRLYRKRTNCFAASKLKKKSC